MNSLLPQQGSRSLLLSPHQRRRLRVLVLGLGWPLETFLERLIRGLAETDDSLSLTLAVPVRYGAVRRISAGAAARRRVRLLRLPRNSREALRLVLRRPRTAWRVKRLLAAQGNGSLVQWGRFAALWQAVASADVIYFPWNSAALEYLPLYESSTTPVLISCRGTQVHVAPHNPERAVLRNGLPRTFRRATRVHCVSRAIREEACTFGLDAQRARIIRPAVDADVFRPSAVSPAAPAALQTEPVPSSPAGSKPLRIVTTGSLNWCKNYDDALIALKRLQTEHALAAHLTVIGDGPQRMRLLHTVRDLGLTEREVTFAGRLAPEAVRARLCEADLFWLSSVSEGVSNAALEAMACGLPVVTADAGGMREAVRDGVDGYVVPVRDPGALAAATARLARDPLLRARMGGAARERVQREFALADQVRAFADLLHEAAAAPTRQGDVSPEPPAADWPRGSVAEGSGSTGLVAADSKAPEARCSVAYPEIDRRVGQ